MDFILAVIIGIPQALLYSGMIYILFCVPACILLFVINIILKRTNLIRKSKKVIFFVSASFMLSPLLLDMASFGLWPVPHSFALALTLAAGDFDLYFEVFKEIFSNYYVLFFNVLYVSIINALIFRYTSRLFKDPVHDIEKSA